jgi:hypothetical protein
MGAALGQGLDQGLAHFPQAPVTSTTSLRMQPPERR